VKRLDHCFGGVSYAGTFDHCSPPSLRFVECRDERQRAEASQSDRDWHKVSVFYPRKEADHDDNHADPVKAHRNIEALHTVVSPAPGCGGFTGVLERPSESDSIIQIRSCAYAPLICRKTCCSGSPDCAEIWR